MAQGSSQVNGSDDARRRLGDALLPALRFAARDDFAHVSRLAGFEALVSGAVRAARRQVDEGLLRQLTALASGFDAGDDAARRRQAREMLALLDGRPEPPGPTARPLARPTARARPASPRAEGEDRAVHAIRLQDAVKDDDNRTPRGLKAHTSTTDTAKTSSAKTSSAKTSSAKTSSTKTPSTKTPNSTTHTAHVPRATLDTLGLSVRDLKGIGPRRAEALEARGLRTVGDLLFVLPRTYEDRRTARDIRSLEPKMLAVVSGTVVASGAVGFGSRGRRYEVVIDDGTGQLRLVFFHFRHGEMQKRFPRGALVTAVGETQAYGARLQMAHPRVANGLRLDELGGIHPVYPEMAGLHPLELGRCVTAALAHIRDHGIDDPLPPHVRVSGSVPTLVDALTEIHAPSDDVDAENLRALLERRSQGHRRLAYEELFVLGLALSMRRHSGHADPAPPLASVAGETEALQQLLPFEPTRAQKRAIAEIWRDLESATPMARMLQGDVGAGKTAVAAAACLRAVRAGHQAAFMAPTELLAEQHGRTLKRLFAPLGVRVEVLTGAMPKKARRLAEARLAHRDLDVVVGTQALLSDHVEFARLGLCVVDEQHRFGVVQRAALRDKGPVVDGIRLAPHLLVMTATPIPRSLALTVYGDLAVSVLDELPPGRTPVLTTATHDDEEAVYAVAQTIARGERAFVVYPLIDDAADGAKATASVELAAATLGYEDLRSRFGDVVGLVHGRIPSAEREEVMARFARGELSVLVATTVIEVGVDVPEATLMVVENAERFGLAQLHQLRGRVGRSHRASRCVLVVGSTGGEDALARVRVLTETNDGFRIAEEDLAIRGPGDVLGTRQAGVPSLAFSDLVRHAPLIERARAAADALLEADPTLAAPEHAGLRSLVLERYATRLALTAAG